MLLQLLLLLVVVSTIGRWPFVVTFVKIGRTRRTQCSAVICVEPFLDGVVATRGWLVAERERERERERESRWTEPWFQRTRAGFFVSLVCVCEENIYEEATRPGSYKPMCLLDGKGFKLKKK